MIDPHPFGDDTSTDFPVVVPERDKSGNPRMSARFRLFNFSHALSDNAVIADSILNQPDPAMRISEYDLTPAEDLAGIGAYVRYCTVVGTTWDGRPLPTWVMLTDKIRKGWAEAGCQHPVLGAGQA